MPEGDGTRRKLLANERTWLAWVRTGLASTGIALAVGKFIPAVDKDAHGSFYGLLGAGYALFGVLLVAYGFQRRRDVESVIESGGFARPDPRVVTVFTVFGTVLGLLSALALVVG